MLKGEVPLQKAVVKLPRSGFVLQIEIDAKNRKDIAIWRADRLSC